MRKKWEEMRRNDRICGKKWQETFLALCPACLPRFDDCTVHAAWHSQTSTAFLVLRKRDRTGVFQTFEDARSQDLCVAIQFLLRWSVSGLASSRACLPRYAKISAARTCILNHFDIFWHSISFHWFFWCQWDMHLRSIAHLAFLISLDLLICYSIKVCHQWVFTSMHVQDVLSSFKGLACAYIAIPSLFSARASRGVARNETTCIQMLH